MALFASDADLRYAQAISGLLYCNPFLPERIDFERAALGDAFVDTPAVWNITHDWEGNRPNIGRLKQKTDLFLADLRAGCWRPTDALRRRN